MKHLFTFTALLVSSLAMGQNSWPWNPDFDGNNLIGVEDLVSVLSVYNTDFVVEYPASSDSPFTIALVKADSSVVSYVDCIGFCASRGGHVITISDFGLFQSEIIVNSPFISTGTSSTGGVITRQYFDQNVYVYDEHSLHSSLTRGITVHPNGYSTYAPGDTLFSAWEYGQTREVYNNIFPEGIKRAECFCAGTVPNSGFSN